MSHYPWPSFNSRSWRSISRNFPWLYRILLTRPKPAWQEMTQSPLNGISQPVVIEKEGRSPTMN